MKLNGSNFNKICLLAAGLISITSITLLSSIVRAQTIPDETLGDESSVVTPQQLRDLIEGGAIRGENLFHSFSESPHVVSRVFPSLVSVFINMS